MLAQTGTPDVWGRTAWGSQEVGSIGKIAENSVVPCPNPHRPLPVVSRYLASDTRPADPPINHPVCSLFVSWLFPVRADAAAAPRDEQLVAAASRLRHRPDEPGVEDDERGARDEVGADDAQPEVDAEVELQSVEQRRNVAELARFDDDRRVGERAHANRFGLHLEQPRQLDEEGRAGVCWADRSSTGTSSTLTAIFQVVNNNRKLNSDKHSEPGAVGGSWTKNAATYTCIKDRCGVFRIIGN